LARRTEATLCLEKEKQAAAAEAAKQQAGSSKAGERAATEDTEDTEDTGAVVDKGMGVGCYNCRIRDIECVWKT